VHCGQVAAVQVVRLQRQSFQVRLASHYSGSK
jgi:hypothetical protein